MFYTPKSKLVSTFIQNIWLIRHSDIPANTKMLPDGHSDIMINLGPAYKISYNKTVYKKISKSVLFGQRTKTLYLVQPGEVRMIGIRLVPGKEGLFINKSAHEIKDTFITLDTLFGSDFRQLYVKLKGTKNEDQILNLLENFFEKYLLTLTQPAPMILPKALDLIQKKKGTLTVLELAQHLKTGYKQSERLFRTHLGLSPLQYIRIVRFYSAFSAIRSQKGLNWSEYLRTFNYYDQSHFIKDYYRYTGLSPNKQLKKKDTIEAIFSL